VALLDSIFSVRFVKDGVEYVQRKTVEFIGASVTIADDPVNERTQITVTATGGGGGGGAPDPHAATHIRGGSDELDADRLQIAYVPTNYTRAGVVDVTTDPDQLTSHLHGIDSSLLDLLNVSKYFAKVTYITEAGASHTFIIGDAYKTILCTSETPVALQIPAHATVPYEVGTVLGFIPMASGQLTVSGAGGVAVVSSGSELKSARQYGPIFAQQTSLDLWLVSGEKSA